MTAVHRLPGLVARDRNFDVPLDHERPGGERLSVFARELVAPGREGDDLPYLVFLQGGPGFASPRPTDAKGWIGRALEEFRVLLLDQRGTGLSTPVSARSLALRGTPENQAEYLTHFRADSIVRDAELVRKELVGADRPWHVLGQSFGGFCATHYLSAAPEGLAGVLITGGLPPLDATADEVYRATYPLVLQKNAAYYERYPGDVKRVRRIARHLDERPVCLPGGARLTVRRFQQLGLLLGFGEGFETLHYLFEEAFPTSRDELGFNFLRGVENALHFETNPLFVLLHEACYAQGVATDWSAMRVRSEFPRFDPAHDGPLHLTGEMIYPWMLEDYAELVPIRETAHLLASRTEWPRLYDPGALARNEVPVAAAIYANDMYVERGFSESTAGKIRGLTPWVTDEYEHNGLRLDGSHILDRLLRDLGGPRSRD